MPKIKIYVISRISKDAHFWTDKVCDYLDDSFEIFKPKDHNPWNSRHEIFSKNVFEVDLDAIKKSHIGLMLPEYGNDCAWESGFYANSEKPAVIFVDNQTEWLRDWMVKGGIDYVITNNSSTYKILKKDPILKYKKIIFVKYISDLNKKLKDIYQKHYIKDSTKLNIKSRLRSWLDLE
jgi:hypothetical protein